MRSVFYRCAPYNVTESLDFLFFRKDLVNLQKNQNLISTIHKQHELSFQNLPMAYRRSDIHSNHLCHSFDNHSDDLAGKS